MRMFGLTVFIVGTTIGAIVSLIVCAGDQRASSKDAWTKFENNTGWSSSKCVMSDASQILTMLRCLGFYPLLYIADVGIDRL
jgi:predicted acylesterase/phospholipase RssA